MITISECRAANSTASQHSTDRRSAQNIPIAAKYSLQFLPWFELHVHAFLGVQAEWSAAKFERDLRLLISLEAEVQQQTV